MATVTGLTAERMLEIEAQSIVGGAVLLDTLILTRYDGEEIVAGKVQGPKGADGKDASLNATPLDSGVDLDAITTPGFYSQISNAGASSGANYPAAVAGVLEVYASPDAAMVWQTYTPYRSYDSVFYKRNQYTSTWGPWRKFVSEDDTGWVNTGLTIPTHASWTLNSYLLRRYNNQVQGQVVLTYNQATTLTSGSDGNFGDMNGMFVLPTGWRKTNNVYYHIPLVRGGFPTFVGRYSSTSGSVDFTAASFNGQVLAQGTQLTACLDYFID